VTSVDFNGEAEKVTSVDFNDLVACGGDGWNRSNNQLVWGESYCGQK
jgi:hypothetical protein